MKQPWMSHQIKIRIMNANKVFHNPEMEAYRQEYLALALVPKDSDSVNRERSDRAIERK